MFAPPEPITAQSNVDRVLTDFPATVPVFLGRRMHCVSCPIARFESIADACRIYRLPVAGFLADLRAATAIERAH